MLSQSDIEFIKENRAELTQGRTETITVVRAAIGEKDPYTGETASGETSEQVEVIWKEVSTVANEERDVVNGVELQNGDIQITFVATVSLDGVIRLEKSGIRYTLVTVDEKGLGEVNRRECIARRTT